MEKLKSYLTLSVFILLIGGAFLLNLILPPPEVLVSERRRPVSFPKFSINNLISTEFMNGFSKYAADNFAFRDELRTIRAASVFYVFRQTDKSGIYTDKSVGAGKFDTPNERSIRRAGEKILKLTEFFPNLNVYYSVIPDKSIYTQRSFPGFDPELTQTILAEQLQNLTYIDLTGALSGGDFYRTDIHWDQSKINGVLDTLSEAIGFTLDKNFNVKSAGEFHGVYTGQLALPQPPDTMRYLTGDAIDSAVIKYFDPSVNGWVTGHMYEIEAASGRDPYDMFLRGVQPLITIENQSANTTNRQLYIFRDSFSSSLAPLLTSAYKTITLIDMRYIDSRILTDYVTFAQTDADVLFLYSSQILNNAEVLLIN
ncbi:MAG: hypothetical protein FWF15_07905 [Oscillospiraceae bacterium]|nr:hypothetical protein [Oscillospiraceae bacterium]